MSKYITRVVGFVGVGEGVVGVVRVVGVGFAIGSGGSGNGGGRNFPHSFSHDHIGCTIDGLS
jgi:hypothetical protein